MNKSFLLAATSDHHVGSTIGLSTPVINRSNGTVYVSNELQLEGWKFWEKSFWPHVWKTSDKEERKVVTIFNAESIDGDHHGTYQVWTHSTSEQCRVAASIFKPIVKKSYRSYFTRGTSAHVLPDGDCDEDVADRVGATQPSPERYSSYHLHQEIGGVLIDTEHHGPSSGTRIWNYGDSLRKYGKTIVLDAMARGLRPPDVIIRSHVHHRTYEIIRDYGHVCHCFITPAWQWKSEHAHRVVSHEDIADVGGLIIKIDDGKVTDAYFKLLSISQTDVVRVI